jgi:hypothetical protein
VIDPPQYLEPILQKGCGKATIAWGICLDEIEARQRRVAMEYDR